MDRIKVLIADDHALIRKGLRELLGMDETIEIVGDVADGDEAVETAKLLRPHLVLMDLRMPRCNGLEATRRLQAEMPDVKVLILTVSEEESDLSNAIKAGARGYILKADPPALLVQAIQYVAHGGIMVSPSMATELLTDLKLEQPPVAAQEEAVKPIEAEAAAEHIPDQGAEDTLESPEGGIESVGSPATDAADSLEGNVELVIASPADPVAVVKLYSWLKEIGMAEIGEISASLGSDTVMKMTIGSPISFRLLLETPLVAKVSAETFDTRVSEGLAPGDSDAPQGSGSGHEEAVQAQPSIGVTRPKRFRLVLQSN